MKGRKRQWWLIPVLIVVFLALIALFWDALVMFFAPQTVLSDALQKTITNLASRIQGSPIPILARGCDENGQNTIQLNLSTSSEVAGDIFYDMKVETDLADHQLFAEGIVTRMGRKLDFSAFLNRDFAALTSQDLLQGEYYGITYNTFRSDLQKIPLLSFFVPSETITDWEIYVSGLQKYMNQTYPLLRIPKVSEDDLKMILLGILTLKYHLAEEYVEINGEKLPCRKLTYSVRGAQVSAFLEDFLGKKPADEVQLLASFYLVEETLVKAELNCIAGEACENYVLTLGRDTQTSDISFAYSLRENNEINTFSVLITTQMDSQHRFETICINDYVISYRWNDTSGDLLLSLPGKEDISLNLSETEYGFRAVTKDFAHLIGLPGNTEYTCTMSIRKGASISVPEYKNLDQWSFEDLLILLSGAGTFLGLNAA